MELLDWIVVGLFFLVMLVIGGWSFSKVKDTSDFFVAGGKLPWWLSGISHHVSGYSGAVFVGYAALAYTQGISIYFWWALTIAFGTFVGAFFLAPRWAQLRIRHNIQSPTEYLLLRYNLPTQQLMAWSGVLLKLFDVGAKWAAIGVLLQVFTGMPLITGILLSGGISLVYITVGGLWADVWTDFAQFVVQILAGLVILGAVLMALGGLPALWEVWDRLPVQNSQVFTEAYPAGFALAFLFINFLSYNGGTWNLATRYISSPSGASARKAALLSAALYLLWPLVLFFPMWVAPLLLPGLEDPSQSYGLLTRQFLPAGLVGLVLASMFANTMSMTSSDANTVASFLTRDILPTLSGRFRQGDKRQSLVVARAATFVFTAITLLIAIQAGSFGGVLGLIINWFGALLGPVAIPMLLGLLPTFRHSDSRAAITSILGGFAAFVFTRYGLEEMPQVVQVASPVGVSFLLYVGMGWLNRRKEVKKEVDMLHASLREEEKEVVV
ncbi:Na+:solute symporter [soil metagenome]